jgi:heme-degrading monooxygenase HmoA
MIARLWRGRADVENAAAYQRHAADRVFPSLQAIPGHRGAYLFSRRSGGETEFLAVTLWDSLESIKAFAGDEPETAVVEPEARAVLKACDDFARHYDVLEGPASRLFKSCGPQGEDGHTDV